MKRPTSWYWLVLFVPAPALAQAPTPPTRPPFSIPQATAPNAAFVIHGWNSTLTSWPELMRDAIRSRTDPLKQNVHVFDWRDAAGNILNSAPHQSLFIAPSYGETLGQQIVARNYQRVHLIGHSAGGELASTAANYIKRVSPNTVVQLTLLDPYVPGLIGLDDGLLTDWTDHYFTEDSGSTLFSYLAWTDSPLPHAFNVDNSAFDPFLQVGHIWEHDWYQNTITNPRPEDQGFGWPLSLEARGTSWNPAAQYPKGDVIPIGGPGNTPYEHPAIAFRQELSNLASLQIDEQSNMGVSVTPASANLTTGGSWVRLIVDTPQGINSLRFFADFTSLGGNGLAAVYWDDEPVRVFDELLAPASPTEYAVYLSEEAAGRHELALRLDGTGSMFSLSNIVLEEVILTSAPATTVSGDYNRNGVVDAADYALWRNTLGQSMTAFNGADGNGDGIVNTLDYDFWRARFGRTSASGQSAFSGVADTPEPETFTLLAVGISTFFFLRPRGHLGDRFFISFPK